MIQIHVIIKKLLFYDLQNSLQEVWSKKLLFDNLWVSSLTKKEVLNLGDISRPLNMRTINYRRS